MDSSPNEKLQFLQQALKEQFPGVPIQVDTIDYGNVLRVTFEVGEKRYAVQSPPNDDWRRHEPRWWLHRTVHHMKEKLTPIAP